MAVDSWVWAWVWAGALLAAVAATQLLEGDLLLRILLLRLLQQLSFLKLQLLPGLLLLRLLQLLLLESRVLAPTRLMARICGLLAAAGLLACLGLLCCSADDIKPLAQMPRLLFALGAGSASALVAPTEIGRETFLAR